MTVANGSSVLTDKLLALLRTGAQWQSLTPVQRSTLSQQARALAAAVEVSPVARLDGATLTVAGQWIERQRLDAMLPHSSTARVETRYRNGLGGVGNASSFNWAMTGGERDIIAFRYVN